MDKIVLPLLSSKVTPRTPGELLDYLLAHALASDYSQSTLCYGKISSFSYVASKYGNNPDMMVKATREMLTNYLSPFFELLDVEVSQTTIPGLPANGSRYGLLISISALDSKNERVNLAQDFTVNGTVMSRLGKQGPL